VLTLYHSIARNMPDQVAAPVLCTKTQRVFTIPRNHALPALCIALHHAAHRHAEPAEATDLSSFDILILALTIRCDFPKLRNEMNTYAHSAFCAAVSST